MPMYDPSGLYVDPILTEFSVGYQPLTYYADKFLPEVAVKPPSPPPCRFDVARSFLVWPVSKRST